MKKQILLGALLLGTFMTANAQLSESFEGATFPPTGWTLDSTNADTWEIEIDGALNGTQSVSVQYDEQLGQQDESLISPSIVLPAAPSSLSFLASLSYFWAVDPNDNYDFIVSISTNGGTTWTAIWDETDLGVFESFVAQEVTVPLNAYAGQTVQLKFQYIGSDGAQLVLDDVVVDLSPTCGVPTAFTAVDPAATPTTINIGWTAPTVGTPVSYEFEYGAAGFTQGTGTMVTTTNPVANLTGLTGGQPYAFYIRTNCGNGEFSEWVGPITFSTPFAPATPPYAFGFEGTSAGGWSALNLGTGGTWQIAIGDATVPAQEGLNLAVANVGTAASNAWFFSRELNLTANSTVTVSYYIKKNAIEGAGLANNLQVTYGTDNTAEAQTNVLAATTEVTNTDFELRTHTFTVPASGSYYIGFNHTAPAHSATNFSVLALDNFTVMQTLSVNNVLASQFTVFPNPTTGVINIANAENILVNGVEIVDINGRTVKSAKFDNVSEAQINISDLATGMYLMNISSDKGTTTKKIVKN